MRVLEAALNATPVGTLTFLPAESTLFVFDRAYAGNPERPTLSQSFRTTDGGVRAGQRPTHVRVPPFFSNLLPEGHLRRYLARKAGVNPRREFFLLWLLGKDLPGAVNIRPADGQELPPEASHQFRDVAGEVELLRFSLAGVQLKLSAFMEANGGLTIPVSGVGGSWILKLPSAVHASVPENEFTMMEVARTIGIDVPETKLVATDSVRGLPSDLPLTGPALAVRRFDRIAEGGRGGQRIHTEDFAQVFNVFPSRKYQDASYENLASVIWAEVGEQGVEEFSRRLAFSVLIGNGDMHLKNWSLIYPDGRSAKLAPAYDLVSTIPYVPGDTMALSLGGTKAWSDVSLDLFRRFAAKARVPESLVVAAVRETSGKLMDVLEHHPAVRELPLSLRQRIVAHARSVPLSGSR